MQSWTDLVREFHVAFDQPNPSEPIALDINTTGKNRLSLIAEELHELETAVFNKDLLGVADALGDLAYVVIGTSVAMGIDNRQEVISRKIQDIFIFIKDSNEFGLEEYSEIAPFIIDFHGDYINLCESIRTNSWADQVASVSMFINDIINLSNKLQLDIDAIFREIHRSNMTKVGGHKDFATGKWIKPDSYSPANLKPIIGIVSEGVANG